MIPVGPRLWDTNHRGLGLKGVKRNPVYVFYLKQSEGLPSERVKRMGDSYRFRKRIELKCILR